MTAPELSAREREIVARFEAAPVLPEILTDRIIAALEDDWQDQCASYKSMSCESCRTYSDAIARVRQIGGAS